MISHRQSIKYRDLENERKRKLNLARLHVTVQACSLKIVEVKLPDNAHETPSPLAQYRNDNVNEAGWYQQEIVQKPAMSYERR